MLQVQVVSPASGEASAMEGVQQRPHPGTAHLGEVASAEAAAAEKVQAGEGRNVEHVAQDADDAAGGSQVLWPCPGCMRCLSRHELLSSAICTHDLQLDGDQLQCILLRQCLCFVDARHCPAQLWCCSQWGWPLMPALSQAGKAASALTPRARKVDELAAPQETAAAPVPAKRLRRGRSRKGQ